MLRSLLIFALFFLFAGYAFAQTSASRLAAGIELFSQGRWNEAVLELRRAQAEAPSRELRAEALFWISMAQLSAGEYEQALREMDALEQTDPGNRRAAQLAYQRGRALFHLERYDEAIIFLGKYTDAIRPGPDGVFSPPDAFRRAAALFWTAECLFAMGQLDRAADIFTTIIENYPASSKFEAAYFRLALINQRRLEAELLTLLHWSHEESLRNTEEFRRREQAYDHAMRAYQRRIADMQSDTRFADIQSENELYRQQLRNAEDRIRYLENLLDQAALRMDQEGAAILERLNNLRRDAEELESRVQGDNQ